MITAYMHSQPEGQKDATEATLPGGRKRKVCNSYATS
jgi:hypothetical protein